VAQTGDEADFIHALNTAAKAMGMTEIAKKAVVTRASLYKSLSENGNPRFATISKVTKALGCRLTVA
jgi:probable addiction module antidote protein